MCARDIRYDVEKNFDFLNDSISRTRKISDFRSVVEKNFEISDRSLSRMRNKESRKNFSNSSKKIFDFWFAMKKNFHFLFVAVL